jgi:hypothetical protein
MCPKSMVTWRSRVSLVFTFSRKVELTSCDTKTSHKVVCDSPDSGLPLERRPVRSNESIERNSHNESNVKPVDVFVPVRSRDGLLSDMRFLGVVLLVTIWLGSLCQARWRLRRVLWWCSHGVVWRRMF